jgi:chemotaxis signal transduction protein
VVVLVSSGGQDIGLLADDASEVRWLRQVELGPSLATGRAEGRSVIRGVTPDLIAVLDLEALFSDPKLTVDDEGV